MIHQNNSPSAHSHHTGQGTHVARLLVSGEVSKGDTVHIDATAAEGSSSEPLSFVIRRLHLTPHPILPVVLSSGQDRKLVFDRIDGASIVPFRLGNNE
jgi:hypothetical protein